MFRMDMGMNIYIEREREKGSIMAASKVFTAS